MTMSTLGDLAQGHMLRGRTVSVKQDIQRLTQELSTGQVANVRDTLAGNYGFLSEVARKTTLLEGYRVAGTEAGHTTAAMQIALENFGQQSRDLSGSLLIAGTSVTGTDTSDVAGEARSALHSMVSVLNTSHAGRALFSGNQSDTPPLPDAASLLTVLTAALAGAATPADIVAQAQPCIDAPGGFDAQVYQGGNDAMTPFTLSRNDKVALDVRAHEPATKRALVGAALAALADDPALGLAPLARAELFDLVGQDMLVNHDNLTALQARVGLAEARIDKVAARNAAEVTSLGMARNTLLGADPYETATKLEEAQFQLQSIYSVTVRMSQLSLVNYL